ncbi:two-component regulator propeller domain-containing protein [Anaerolineales bacterium HSG25]|nr:two-component regulator propeller domain-containing protein [Anaerolineales bacterium HSG25]
MKQNSKIVAVICCLGILVSYALTIPYQVYGFSEPPWQVKETNSTNINLITYGKYEGLLAKDIKGIVQDADGYIYLGTNEGIWKYNGSQFYQLVSEQNGLSSNSVFGLLLDSRGNMWASTNKGLNKISNGKVTAIFSPDTTIWTKAIEDTDGNIWFAELDNNLLNKIEDDQIVATYSAEDGVDGLFKLISNPSGGIWVGTHGGLLKFNNDHVERSITTDDGLRDNSIHEIFSGHNNSIWFSDIDGGLSQISGDDVTSYVEPIAGYLETALVDTDSNFWLGSSSGLVQYREGKNPSIFTTSDGLADNYVLTIFEDRDGNIWIGTGNGVSKITKEPVVEGYEGYKIYSQLVDQQSQIWLGTANGLHVLADGQIIKSYTQENGLGSDNIKAVVEDKNHNIWVGTTDGLTLLKNGEVTRVYRTEDGLVDNAVWSLLLDNQEHLWVGTNSGITILEQEKVVKTISGSDLFESDPRRIVALIQDHNNQIWVGARGEGVFVLNDTGKLLQTYKEADGLIGTSVRDITSDPQGAVWVVTSDGGIHKIANQKIVETYTGKNGPYFDNPRAIIVGDNGTVWVGLDGGLGVTTIVDGEFKKNYSYADGLVNATIYSLNKDSDGNILIGTGGGLVKLDPTPFQLETEIDAVTLPQVDEQGRSSELNMTTDGDRYRLSYEQNPVRFRYASLDHRIETKRFQTILEGYDKVWQDMGPQTFRTYMNLPAGNYTFRVRTQNFDGSWSPDEASVAITLSPPWWETLWFRGLMIVAVIGMVAGLFRWRVKSIEARNQQLENQVAERTKALTERGEELARSNEQLTIAQQKAEVANQAKSVFLANMSHELRSPLNAVLGFSQIMVRSQTLSHENQENVGIILRSGEHLLSLINQVLDLSKIEAGQTTLNQHDFDLHRLIEDVEDMFSLKAADKNLQLVFDVLPTVPQYIRTDEVKFRQVLINLLNNALKFTEEGGVSVRAKCEKLQDNSKTAKIIVEVEDTGAGIAPDEMEALFKAFVQTETGKQSKEGTGLGLPISRKFVQLMGGDITVSSEIGHGTIFRFEVVVELIDALSTTKKLRNNIIALQPGQPTYRILIVDDRVTNRKLLVKLLVPLGFQVQEANNGQEAIDLWQTWKPDLIWMDMRMPVLDGYEATKQIKATDIGQATTVIALTASVFEEERAVVLAAGCDDFLRKPFKDRDIFALMEKYLGVQYIYEQPEPSKMISTDSQTNLQNLQTALNTLPPELLEKLHHAASHNNLSVMNSLIEQISHIDNPLSDSLAALADDFDYDKIAELAQHGIEDSKTNG